MQKTKIKEFLDNLNIKYETKKFITNDPIKFPHNYTKREDIEIVAFLSSMFAYGSRKIFCVKLQQLFDFIGDKPLEFVLSADLDNVFLHDFNYRFSKGIDLIQILLILRELYKKSDRIVISTNGFFTDRIIDLCEKTGARIIISSNWRKFDDNGSYKSSIHGCWKNHSFDYIDLCQQSNISAF